MDDLFYRCVFEAEKILRMCLYRVEETPSRLGTYYYKVLCFQSPMLNKKFMKRMYWQKDDPQPSFSQQYLIKQIAELLYDFLKRGDE